MPLGGVQTEFSTIKLPLPLPVLPTPINERKLRDSYQNCVLRQIDYGMSRNTSHTTEITKIYSH